MSRLRRRSVQSVLVFIDGTICDDRQRLHLLGTPDFSKREEILKDTPTPGSVECLQMLARMHVVVYLGARSPAQTQDTADWLARCGYPEGPVFLAETQEERLATVRDLCCHHSFAAGRSGTVGMITNCTWRRAARA
jgi:hypothetical protein